MSDTPRPSPPGLQSIQHRVNPQAPQPVKPMAVPGQMPGARPAPPPAPLPPQANDTDSIELVDDLEAAVAPGMEKKIRAFGVTDIASKKNYKRQLVKSGQGACRVRSFHGKYSEQGLEYLDNAINEWLDNNPDVEVKFVTSTVMTFEGKIREPALVLNVWF